MTRVTHGPILSGYTAHFCPTTNDSLPFSKPFDITPLPRYCTDTRRTMNPFSPRRKHVGRRSRNLPRESSSAVSSLFAPPTLASTQASTRNQTEIHWNPPKSVKRQDPSTPLPVSFGRVNDDDDAVSPLPMKTRRLLPPSRRVDDGDDEVGIESPPSVVRKSRTNATTSQTAKNTTTNKPVKAPTKQHSNRSTTTQDTTKAGVPVAASSRHSKSTEDMDTFEPMFDSPGARSLMLRMESLRSMASKSMASHSTQAELDFYLRRCHLEDSSVSSSSRPNKVMAAPPPQWIPSSPQRVDAITTTSSLASTTTPLHQRRRIKMLAKSAGNMLRSHRPAWDRTESMHSTFSQASASTGWSGWSRASSRKSLATSVTSRTPTPPEHVRSTSNGTTHTKPRHMVTSNPIVMECAHRPVPAVASSTSSSADKKGVVTTPTTTNAATTTQEATESLRQMELDTSPRGIPTNNKPSLLDDDEAVSDLWKPKHPPPTAVAPPPFGLNDEDDNQLGGKQPQPPHDTKNATETGNEAATMGEPWEPQLGGSFMVYRRTQLRNTQGQFGE